MADQLQFRGGTTSEVSAASVASREIFIDTQTNEIAVGSSKKRTVMQESNGDVEIGGGNILLNANGSTAFKGATHEFGIQSSAGPQYITINSGGGGVAGRYGYGLRTRPFALTTTSNSAKTLFCGGTGGSWSFRSNTDDWTNIGSEVAAIESDGSAEFAGTVSIGGTLPAAPAIELNDNGSAQFAGITQSGTTNLSSTTSSGVNLNPAGQLVVQRTAGSGSNALLWRGYSGDTQTSLINSGGSAEFAGTVKAAGSAGGVDSITAGTTGASKYFVVRGNGTVLGNDNGAASTSSYKYRINASGSAEFTGSVTTAGVVQVNRPENSTSDVFRGYAGSTLTSAIKGDGTGLFKGPVSIGGTAAANTIDEYEEGNCTVDLTVGGSAAGLTGSNAQGTYTRIGNLCQVQINLTITSASVSGLTGVLAITGLPFVSPNTTSSNYASSPCLITNWATDYKSGNKTIMTSNSANSTALAIFAGNRITNRLTETALDFSSGNCSLFTTLTYRIA